VRLRHRTRWKVVCGTISRGAFCSVGWCRGMGRRRRIGRLRRGCIGRPRIESRTHKGRPVRLLHDHLDATLAGEEEDGELNLPGLRFVTSLPHCRTMPAASWPRMQSPSTTSEPILPAFQKWISDLADIYQLWTCLSSQGILPTNTRSLDMQQHFSLRWRINRRILQLQVMVRGDLQRGIW